MSEPKRDLFIYVCGVVIGVAVYVLLVGALTCLAPPEGPPSGVSYQGSRDEDDRENGDHVSAGKGDTYRKVNWQKYGQEYDRIFRPVCPGCGQPGPHKMCPAHGTDVYMNPSHPDWGKPVDKPKPDGTVNPEET